MKVIRIKINSLKISSKINKKQLQWASNFLKRKIKNNFFLNDEDVECILIDYNSKNIEKYKIIFKL